MDKVSGVGVVKKSNRVRRVFCPIWKRPYHKNCNCLADENEIDDIVTEFEHLPTSTKQFPKIKRKRGRPKKKIEIVEINNQPITSNSNQNMVPKKKWRLAYLNNDTIDIEQKFI
uniref:Uncharacterized protein n=1 Tax=Sipha flava TaxID=143950 RepID=A0A2S2RAV8_9HEMI